MAAPALRPRTRWAGIVWGLVLAAVAAAGIWRASADGRLAELLARVRALLRRKQSVDVVIEAGDIHLDARGRRVLVGGQDTTLANREFDLLRYLMERGGEVVSREEILTEVWGTPDLLSSKTLDMHISWLRRKIGDDQPGRKKRIVTVRGVGFRFDPD